MSPAHLNCLWSLSSLVPVLMVSNDLCRCTSCDPRSEPPNSVHSLHLAYQRGGGDKIAQCWHVCFHSVIRSCLSYFWSTCLTMKNKVLSSCISWCFKGNAKCKSVMMHVKDLVISLKSRVSQPSSASPSCMYWQGMSWSNKHLNSPVYIDSMYPDCFKSIKMVNDFELPHSCNWWLKRQGYKWGHLCVINTRFHSYIWHPAETLCIPLKETLQRILQNRYCAT